MRTYRTMWLSLCIAVLACDDGGAGDGEPVDADGEVPGDTGAGPSDSGTAAMDAGSGDPPDASAGSDAAPSEPDAGPPPGAPVDPTDLTWPAPAFEDACGPDLPRTGVECATVDVPRDWARPDGTRIAAAMARFPAEGPPRGQLWLLNGGPGGAGSELATLVPRLRNGLPDLDIYLPDHRGTGRSNPLGCPTQEAEASSDGTLVTDAEWPDCAAEARAMHGADLPHMTATNAARDLIALIESVRGEGDVVYVWGVSYGTFWADRALALGLQVDAVMMDSMCPPGLCRGDLFDERLEAVASEVLAGCREVPACAERLGPDPWAIALDVMARVDGGHCAEVEADFPALSLRRAIALVLDQAQFRAAVPAVLHRLDRCNEADVRALKQFLGIIHRADPRATPPKTFSDVLGVHVMLSEMWGARPGGGPEGPDWLDAFGPRVFAPGFGVPMALIEPEWPVYEAEALAGALATPPADLPILVVNGSADHQTPPAFAEAAAEAYGDAATVVILPGAAHATIVQSPTRFNTHCGLAIATSFFTDPGAPNLACVDGVLPPAYVLPSASSTALFGTADPWGDAE
jgi:pimeloyl-ACP methyl ester carboxylesterase